MNACICNANRKGRVIASLGTLLLLVSLTGLLAAAQGERTFKGVVADEQLNCIQTPMKAPEGMKAPLTLRQMHPEGGTLGYLIRFHSHQILVFGGMNYIEREIEGLQPDVVLVGAAGSRKEIYDYSGRLMRALHFPALVLPTHWDNFTAPYGASQQTSIDALQSFIEEMKAASPKTKVITPKYFEAIPLSAAAQ